MPGPALRICPAAVLPRTPDDSGLSRSPPPRPPLVTETAGQNRRSRRQVAVSARASPGRGRGPRAWPGRGRGPRAAQRRSRGGSRSISRAESSGIHLGEARTSDQTSASDVGPDVAPRRPARLPSRVSGTASPVRPSASLEVPDTAAPRTRQVFLPIRPIRIGDGSEPLTPSHRHRREHHDRGSCTQPPDAYPHRARRRRPRSRCRPRCDGGRLRARARAADRDAPLIPAGSPSTGGSAAALSATPSPRRPTGLSGCHRSR